MGLIRILPVGVFRGAKPKTTDCCSARRVEATRRREEDDRMRFVDDEINATSFLLLFCFITFFSLVTCNSLSLVAIMK